MARLPADAVHILHWLPTIVAQGADDEAAIVVASQQPQTAIPVGRGAAHTAATAAHPTAVAGGAAHAADAASRMWVIIAIAPRRAAHTHHNHNDEGHQENAAHDAGQNAEEWPDVLDDGGIGQREVCERMRESKKGETGKRPEIGG